MDELDRDRLAKLCGMFGSNQIGERASAAAKMHQLVASKDDFGKAINPAIKKFLRDTQTIVALEIFATGLKFNWIEAEPLLTNIEILNEHHRFDTTRN